jgi:hypothetical protein
MFSGDVRRRRRSGRRYHPGLQSCRCRRLDSTGRRRSAGSKQGEVITVVAKNKIVRRHHQRICPRPGCRTNRPSPAPPSYCQSNNACRQCCGGDAIVSAERIDDQGVIRPFRVRHDPLSPPVRALNRSPGSCDIVMCLRRWWPLTTITSAAASPADPPITLARSALTVTMSVPVRSFTVRVSSRPAH